MRKYYRYHCFDRVGKKIVRCFKPNVEPQTLADCTEWVAGSGPITGEALERVRAGVAKLKGVPKSAEHRAKMSAASKGKPKSAEHRLAMSRAHRARAEMLKEQQRAST